MLEDVSKLLRLSTAKLVNEAINTPNNTVSTDSAEFKKLKSLVRNNGSAIPDYVDYLFSSLKRSDCERRSALLSLFDYFFNRSHVFRLETVNDLQELLHLVCETDPFRYPLPGPVSESKQLKIYGIKTIKKWFEKFGAGYEKLFLVGDYLKESKTVDFEFASAELLAERKRKAVEEQRAAERLQKTAENVCRKFNDARSDIERCLATSEAALSILVPVFGIDNEGSSVVSKDNNTENHSSDNVLEIQHGPHGYSASETISLVLTSLAPEVSVNEDNEAVIETIRDVKVMLDVYKKNLIGWERKIVGASGIGEFIRDLTNLKRKVEQQCEKIEELKLKPKTKKRNNDSDSEESDLEDVPEKQLEDFVPPEELPRHILDRVRELERDDEPCCSKSLKPNKAGLLTDDLKISSDKSDDAQSRPRIPVVSFDLDLKYWGEKHKDPVVMRNNIDTHRFWRPPDDDDKPLVSEKEAAFSEVRMITWIGEPRRAERRCKARLSSGKLCPRMDFHKCPIHGVIVDRDDEGFPIEEVDMSQETPAQKERVKREEDEYMRDLEAGTGRSFTVKQRKKKKRSGETVRERLEKKLLNPRTVKRVSAALDAARKAKLQRKFGDQFAHALSK